MNHLKARIVGFLVLLAMAVPLKVPASWMDPSEAWSELESAIRDRGLDPAQIEIPGRISKEMENWARAQVKPGLSAEKSLRQLLAAMVDPQGSLELKYEPGYTGTAVEVFESKTANCLAFTHMFVGMSRSLGLRAFYVRWRLIERFRRQADLVVVSGHVSAGFGESANWLLLEFGAVTGLDTQGAERISDLNALSRHYSNRSAELLSQGRVEAAIDWATTAVTLDGALAGGWVNLGVSKRRAGDLTGAEESYRKATAADPDHFAAYHNLIVLMRLRGQTDAAQEIVALLDRRGNRNPFIYLELGDESLKEQRLDEARRFYNRASKLGPELAETRAARGFFALAEERPAKAQKWLLRAQSVDPEESRTRSLAARLSASEGEDG